MGSNLFVDLKVLGLVSPLGGQNVTSWTGQRITDQKIPITLHQVFCNLQQYKGLDVGTHTHTNTHACTRVRTVLVYSPNISLNLTKEGCYTVTFSKCSGLASLQLLRHS